VSVPVRANLSIFNPSTPVVCAQHGVNVTIWADYAIWCDSHGAFIGPELTTNFLTSTDE
jgi:hypothetical protein